MSIESLKQTLDNEFEGSLMDGVYTKEEKEQSRLSFLRSLKQAVANGGKVITETRAGKTYFSFKPDGKGFSYCITKADAVEFCGYKDE